MTLRILLLALSLSGALLAQSTEAEVIGVVKDPASAAVPNATVTLANVDTGVKRSVATTGDGHYRFYPVAPGRYSLTAAATGFAPSYITGLQIDIGMHVDRDIPLQ